MGTPSRGSTVIAARPGSRAPAADATIADAMSDASREPAVGARRALRWITIGIVAGWLAWVLFRRLVSA